MNEYLATGFANVDGCDDSTEFKHCLALLDSLPYFHEYKQRSYGLLTLSTGLSVLEIGCGLGDDAFRMASSS
jgi:ubiquinone/menaquinone biosynthesis C-methylase UbiE